MPFEGEHPKPYYDPPHVATDCFGHTQGVKMSDRPTNKDCLIYLGQDTEKAERGVDRVLKVKVSEKTKAAYISFAFNLGSGAFATSSILRDANAGRIEDSCNDFAACELNKKKTKYVGYGCGWAGGKRLPGLEARRLGEKQLCLEGIGK